MNSFLTKTLLLIVITISFLTVKAQTVNCGYSFSSGSGFSAITGTSLGNAGDVNYEIDLSGLSPAFNFDYNGTSYNKFGVNGNGWIWVGGVSAPAASTTTPISSALAVDGIIAPWGGILSNGTASNVSYLVMGTAPDRRFIVYWNVTYNPPGFTNYSKRIEAILYENNPGGANSNKIQFSYASQGSQITTMSGSVEIGLRGATNADYNNRFGAAGSGAFGLGQMTSSSTSAGTSNSSKVSFNPAGDYISGNITFTYTPGINTPTITPLNPVVCGGGGVTLTAHTTLPVPANTTYQWLDSSGNPIDGAIDSTFVSSSEPGSHYYKVKVTNGTSCSRISAINTITISSGGSLSLGLSPLFPTVCSGSSVPLTASGAEDYSWSPSEGLDNTTGSTVHANPLTTTTYTVTGTAGSCSGTQSVVVSVGSSLTVKVEDAKVCKGSVVLLSATGADAFTWSPSTGLSATEGSTVGATPNTTTTYTITGNSITGCSGSTTAIVTVDSTPVVKASDASTCKGEATDLVASGADTYSWSPANGLNTTTGSTVNANPASTTTYTVNGTYSSNSCSGSTTLVLTVNQLPAISVPGTEICNGSLAVLTANGASTYTWAPATGLDATTGTSVNAGPSVTATYTITGTDGKGCTGNTTAIVTVNPLPTVQVDGETICKGGSATLDATGADAYTWAPANGLTVTTGASVSANAFVTTTYTIVGTNTTGCSSSTTALFTVNDPPVVNVPSKPVCSGSSVVLTASGADAYTWSPSSGLDATTGDAVNANPSITTVYTITGTNIGGCSATTTATVSVKENPAVPVAIDGSGAAENQIVANWIGVAGATTYFLDVSTDNAFGSFVGGYNNLNVGNATSKTVTGLSKDILYYYRVRASNNCGTSDNSNVIAYSTSSVSPCSDLNGGTITPSLIVVCQGTGTTFTNSGSAGGTLQWQASNDNINWNDIAGATENTYSTPVISQKEYYRSVVISPSCYNIASTTAVANISVTPVVTITNVTSSTATVTWTPYGSGQYNISWTGAGTGLATAVTTNNFVITDLNSNEDVQVTVTPATPECNGANAGTAKSRTLCAIPIVIEVIAAPAPAHAFKVRWASVNGAGSYRLFYRNVGNSNAWSFIDTAGTNKTVFTPQGGQTYAVYVAVKNCPALGKIGEPSIIYYITTNPASGCSPVPTVSASSNCPNQISVTISGNGGPYLLTVREISPKITTGITSTVNTSSLNITIGSAYSGTVWEVFARKSCGTGNSSDASNVVAVIVKPACPVTNNVILSEVFCNGFTASWNSNTCLGIGVTSYSLLIKKSGTLNFSSYPVGYNTHKEVTWLTGGNTYNVGILAVACNGAPSAYSLIDTVTIPACRTELDNKQIAVDVTAQQESVVVYPNPSQGQFYVDLGRTNMDDATVKIELVDQLGRTIQTQLTLMTGGHLSQVINTPDGLAEGIYFVRTSVEGNVYTSRLVISKN